MFASSLVALSVAALSAHAATHRVIVGGLGDLVLTFQPYAVAAEIGDIVEFEFRQKNHTVLRTSFGNVCHPLLDEANEPVFDTGFQAAAADQTEGFAVVPYEVTTLDPLWFYCGQTSHCGRGMVFSINCPFEGPNSFDNFRNSALEIGAREELLAGASSSWAATATPDVYAGTLTFAPIFQPTVTATVTFEDEVWTTTYASYPNSPDPTPDAAAGIEHRVIVGGDGTLTYDPPAIAAAPRDTIVFEFRSKNHTATQSSFGNPCRKLELTSTTGQVGFDSGFMPVSAEVSASGQFPTYTVTVNDTAPIWVYCRQGDHCGQGMVFSVNADEASERNHVSFEALAQTINGTGSDNGNDNGNDGYGSSAVSIRVGAISSALLAVGSLFVLAL